MFVDRKKELSLLKKEYLHENFRFSVIYGRRRVGKTTLIKEYIEDKPAIYFLVTLETKEMVLRRFQNLVADFFGDDFLRDIGLSGFDKLFEYIAKQKLDKKLIIVIDEFQYLTKIDSAIPSIFQFVIDEILKSKNIHLVFCGSIISMMYEQTLSYSSPLYGRRTSAMKIEALRFEYISEFFEKKSQNELIELYSILDGVPKYLEMFKDSKNIYKSIKDNILDKNSYLYEEPRYILQSEVKEPLNYFSILETIANGEHKIGKIAGKLNKNVQNITSFISKLIELDVLYKEVPITEKQPSKSKKGLYFIKDNFFRFWFLYVLGNKSQLEIENSDVVLEKIKENFSGFVAKTYEDICIEYTLKNYDVLKCGRWWSKSEEIDLIAVAKNYMLVGECKYSNKKVGTDILVLLQKKSLHVELKLPIEKYILFSKSGFTDELIELSKKDEKIELIKELI